jgi:hypothetical protein
MIEINESEESDDSTDGPMNCFPVNVNAMPIDMSDESDFDTAGDDEEDEENYFYLFEVLFKFCDS